MSNPFDKPVPVTPQLGIWADNAAQAVTDANVKEIIEIAAYGGVTHWAVQPQDEDFDGAQPDTVATFVPEASESVHLTADDIRKAYVRLLAGIEGLYIGAAAHRAAIQAWRDRTEQDGIDTSRIDADAADQIIQLACFGHVMYA
ncbi:hypothetical protein [Streptomyces variabilis]